MGETKPPKASPGSRRRLWTKLFFKRKENRPAFICKATIYFSGRRQRERFPVLPFLVLASWFRGYIFHTHVSIKTSHITWIPTSLDNPVLLPTMDPNPSSNWPVLLCYSITGFELIIVIHIRLRSLMVVHCLLHNGLTLSIIQPTSWLVVFCFGTDPCTVTIISINQLLLSWSPDN